MSITLGGKTATELNIRILRGTQEPITAATRDRTLEIPGRHGAYDFGADLSVRTFALECAILADSSTDLQTKIRALAAHLMDMQGRPRTLELVFDVEPDRHYNVRYSGNLPVERIAALGLFTLPLTAFDPFAYGAEQEKEQLVETSPEVIAVESSGNVETPPVIILENEGVAAIDGFIIRQYVEV